jgi:hypothetical protein
MPAKGDVHVDEESQDKNKRKVMSLSEKVEVLDKLHRRISTVVVRCHCGVNKFRIFFIKKNEDKSGETLKLVLHQV